MKENRRQNRQDIRFVRKVGKMMLQWEKQREKEIETHTFLLTVEAAERLDAIQNCIQNAKAKPYAFRWELNPVYNQIEITLEDYVFSGFSYPLHEILRLVDVYSIDARTNGCIVLSAGINNAASKWRNKGCWNYCFIFW